MKTSNIQPILGTPLNRSHPLSQGLVGDWLLNEGGGLKVQDSTRINSIDGTFVGGAVLKQTTKGNALFIPGTASDRVTFPSNSFISTFNNITVSVWAYFITLPAFSQILQKNSANSNYYGIVVQSNGLVTWQCNAACNTGTSVVVAGKWYHICGTRNINLASNQAVVYINGVNLGVATSTTTISTSTTLLSFGYDLVNGRNANALYQDIKIYSRALSLSEVWQLYTNPYQMYIGKVR